jgi:hypothetical protein
MGVSSYDGDDVNVKGDDGSDDGVKITVTADGAKKRLDVEAKLNGTSTVAETELATYTAYAESVAIGNNKSMISITNASDSTVLVKIREIKLINVQTAAVTGVIADFKMFRCTSHSAGTSITVALHDTNDTLSGSVTARTGATISGEVTTTLRRWQFGSDEWNVGTQDAESDQHAIAVLTPAYQSYPKMKPFMLRANQGITIKCVTNSTAGSFDCMISFTVETA